MALTGIIAECGSMHMGDVEKAKEMARIAKESGANFVKFQAINPETVAQIGSMPLDFYKKCALKDDEYLELYLYGKEIGIPVFFSVFGRAYFGKEYFKISGFQFMTWNDETLAHFNRESTIVSIPKTTSTILAEKKEHVSKMNLLYVAPYLENPNFGTLIRYRNFFDRDVGLSDHSVGIGSCITAIKDYDCKLIEKHFSLGDEIVWEGKVFRDSLHSASPKQLEKLATTFREHHGNA